MKDLIGITDLIGSVVRVGDGRGFIVHTDCTSYIITAAHVLPFLPPAHLGRYLDEETYRHLIGPRDAEPSVTAVCMFADPVADLAVLGPPDGQELDDEYQLYEGFTQTLPPFDVAAPPPRSRLRLAGNRDEPSIVFVPHAVTFPAHVLSLEGAWHSCNATYRGGPFVIEPEDVVIGGMSGSPLISTSGAALGVISTSNVAACLSNGLPGWLLRALACGSPL